MGTSLDPQSSRIANQWLGCPPLFGQRPGGVGRELQKVVILSSVSLELGLRSKEKATRLGFFSSPARSVREKEGYNIG